MDNAEKALDELQTNLIGHIIPIAATVILLCLAIGYAGRYIARGTRMRWGLAWLLLA